MLTDVPELLSDLVLKEKASENEKLLGHVKILQKRLRSISPTIMNRENRLQDFDDMCKKITPDDDDKKRSRAYVDETLRQIIGHVREQEYGDIYGHQIVKAGSYPINAKIWKADEFDTNIIFNIEPKKIHERGQCGYIQITEANFYLNASQANLLTYMKLVRTPDGEEVPNGYAVVEVDRHEIPPYFRHEEPMMVGTGSSIKRGNRARYIHVIPRDVKQDLHKKVKAAKTALNLDEVKVSDACHGPALTLTITPDQWSGISHKISVDVTVSLKCSLPFKHWPREETYKAFDASLIDAAIDAGIHLVPKKDLFWAISFSRAERVLLSSIDKGLGCRKRVLKILKAFLEIAGNLPGMSSHVLKTQLLWSCEKHADDSDYWNNHNRDICLLNTMSELIESLTTAYLLDYFNPSINILQGKDPDVLEEFVITLRKLKKIKQM